MFKKCMLLFLVALAWLGTDRAAAGVPYRLYLIPTGVGQLDQSIKQNSILASRVTRPPLTAAGLRRRIKRDKQQLSDLLRSEGYYAGRVSIIRTRGSKDGSKGGAKEGAKGRRLSGQQNGGLITILTDPGPAFTYDRFTLRLTGTQGAERKALNQNLPSLVYRKGDRAQAKGVLDAQSRILKYLADHGYPYAGVTERRILVDYAANTLSTELELEAGPKSVLGSVRFEGLNTSEAEFVKDRFGLKSGRSYSRSELDAAKQRLLNTGLFSNVTLRTPDAAPAYGIVPVTVELKEKKKRQATVSLGASFKKGPLASLEWRHRDLFGKAQNLSVRLQGNSDQVSGNVTLEWPDFLRDNRILTADLAADYEKISGIETLTVDGGVRVGRWYRKQKGFLSVGPQLSYLKSNGATSDTETYLASLPVTVKLDQSNNLLDPEKGFRAFAELSPFINLKDTSRVFFKAEAGATAYAQLRANHKLTLAAWLKAGAITGEDIANIPVKKRFYLGGPGSVRGFADKSISPPGYTGGVAKIEGGMELRHRLSKKTGAVVFLEAGKIYSGVRASVTGGLHAGVGFGFRYFSNFGPVRADIAIPVTKKSGRKNPEISVGLGQAF